MSFASELKEWVNDQTLMGDYDSVEFFWRDLSANGKQVLGKHKLVLLDEWNGPESGKYDWQFVFSVGDNTYLAIVDYDSYEYSGSDYALYNAEPFTFTETRYKRVSAAQ